MKQYGTLVRAASSYLTSAYQFNESRMDDFPSLNYTLWLCLSLLYCTRVHALFLAMSLLISRSV